MFTHSRLPLDGAGGEAYSEASVKKQNFLGLMFSTFYGIIPVRFYISDLQLFPTIPAWEESVQGRSSARCQVQVM